MATKKQKFQVSIFLLVSVSLVLTIIYFVSGMYSNYGVRYRIEFDESVLGIYEGGVVEYLGVPVGKIEEIKVSREGKPNVVVNIDSKKVTLHKGVEANLVIYSLAAGTMAISLRGGDPNAPILPPGSKIPARRSTISAVSSRIEELVEDLKNILDSVKKGMEGLESGDLTEIAHKVDRVLEKGEEVLDNAKNTLKNIEDTLGKIEPKISKTLDTSEKTVGDIKQLSKKAEDLVTTINEKAKQLDIQKTQDNLNNTMEEIQKLSKNVNDLVNDLKSITSTASYKVDNVEFSIQKTLEEMNQTLESLRNVLDTIKNNPASLIRGKAYPKEGK
ncbi:MAG TPA: MlaD family protein [Candidatus Hydrogenedens sp.]|nr:MlaD family protein [Candidatus Hydrogenedens sp.]HOK10035.1 MlaD family protein [Candidatus Hydrogenedens sp.]HOL19972.1 MlaD family protein [Candidatus Hydrogenedens sp.]HPP59599.1 MlaD family protein [Candidatus Hydrogenedens sp.]